MLTHGRAQVNYDSVSQNEVRSESRAIWWHWLPKSEWRSRGLGPKKAATLSHHRAICRGIPSGYDIFLMRIILSSCVHPVGPKLLLLVAGADSLWINGLLSYGYWILFITVVSLTALKIMLEMQMGNQWCLKWQLSNSLNAKVHCFGMCFASICIHVP